MPEQTAVHATERRIVAAEAYRLQWPSGVAVELVEQLQPERLEASTDGGGGGPEPGRVAVVARQPGQPDALGEAPQRVDLSAAALHALDVDRRVLVAVAERMQRA